jgi:hypothetical protein
MDFKTLLQSMDTISEDSKVHKGTYGTSHGKEDVRDQYGHKIGKINKDADSKKDEPKKGRGRPKKGAGASGEDKSYDSSELSAAFGGGKKPSKEVGKRSVKHSLKEYIEEAEANQQLDEGGPYDLPGIDYDRPGDAPRRPRMSGGSTPRRHNDDPDFMDPDQRRLRADQERVKKAQDAHHAKKNKGVAEAGVAQHAGPIVLVHKAYRENLAKAKAALERFHHSEGIGKQLKLYPPSGKYGPDYYEFHLDKKPHNTVDMVERTLKSEGVKAGVVDGTQSVEEDMNSQAPVTIKPASQTNTQVIQQGNKTLGTVTNPQLAAQIKQSIGKGEMTLNPDEQEMSEDLGLTAALAGGALAGAKLGKTIGMYRSAKGDEEAGIAKPRTAWERAKGSWKGSTWPEYGDSDTIEKKYMYDEAKDLPGKQDKLDVAPPKGKLTKADFAALRSKKKVSESMQLTESQKEQMIKFFDELELGPKGYNIKPAVELKDKALAASVINKTLAHGRFKGMAGSYKDQMRDAALEHFGFTNYDESLEEGDLIPHPSKDLHTTHGMDSAPSKFVAVPSPGSTPKTKWGIDPIERGTQELSGMGRKAFDFIKGTGKQSTFEGNDMKDVQLESWESQLDGLLTEGITVSTSTGQQGAPDSVSINATEHDASELMSILRNSGLGVFGGQEQQAPTGYGVVSQGEEEPSGTGTAPETSPNVVGDGDDMMALIKKMTGISSQEQPAATSDYEDEEGDEEEMTSADADSDEEGSEEVTGDEEQDSSEEDEVDEGYEETAEGNKFTGNLAKARAAGKQEADLDGDGDMEKVREGHDHEECNECGYPMESCECDTQVEEGFSNDAGGDAMADTELMKLKALLSMGNDLHKMKQSQAVGNPTKVTMETKLMNDSTNLLTDWKKLSGIK